MHFQWIRKRFVFISALFALIFAVCFYGKFGKGKQHAVRIPPNPEEPLPPSSSVLHKFKTAGICTDSEVCSQMAGDSLSLGGSAVDAALTALLCNGLIGMQSMGLGGGMIMNVYVHAERRAYSILSREMAPQSVSAANYSRFADEQQLKQSGWSVAVPTELQGYALAHARFGKLPWRDLVKPTVELCRRGYALYKHQYDALVLNEQMIRRDALLRRMFIDATTNSFWKIGTHIQPPTQLCETYERIAEEGPLSFYQGSWLAKLRTDLKDIDSIISETDLKNAKAELRHSITVPLDEYDLHLTPPPGSGHVVGFIMNILKVYSADFAAAGTLGALEIHRIVEAMKFGFVQRWQLDEVVDEQLLANLTNSAFAASITKLIDDSQTYNKPEHYGASPGLHSRDEHGTAHISVLHNNDAVSVTSTINFYFGSGRMGKRTGVLFNNAMSDFSMQEAKNYFDLPFVQGKNMPVGGARPMSSMCPLIVTERATGQVRLVVGAAGGTKIITALVPLLVRIIWQQANIKAAIDASRFHHQMLPNVLQYEYGLLQSQVRSLEAKGHRCERYRNRGSVICGVARDENEISVNSDYRKIGGVYGA